MVVVHQNDYLVASNRPASLSPSWLPTSVQLSGVATPSPSSESMSTSLSSDKSITSTSDLSLLGALDAGRSGVCSREMAGRDVKTSELEELWSMTDEARDLTVGEALTTAKGERSEMSMS